MLIPGPSSKFTPFALASAAMAVPISRSKLMSKLDAIRQALGKQVALSMAVLPSSFFISLRKPFGPSAMKMLPIPTSGSGLVRQPSSPEQSEALASGSSLERIASYFLSMLDYPDH